MIEKHAHVAAFDPVHGQQVFVLPGNEIFEKTASIVKEAQVSDEIAQEIATLKKESGHRYVLVNGIGAGEYWSSNRNGDFFSEAGLKHAGDDYGYRTFLSGHNFIHHQNKDPQRAVGTVKVAHYNPRMHRVELLIDTDLDKLAKADPELYEKVANGEAVDVSMGSKCDFDVCSICSKRSATRAEYCSHLKEAMNQTLSDGRKVYAYTPHPRFFDISYVTKGADVTAKALHYLDKGASEGAGQATVKTASVISCPDPALHEEVSCEAGYTTPEFPADHRSAVRLLEAVEPAIDEATLDAMAKVGYNEALSTLSHFGVVLSPAEYQRLTLTAIGEQPLAEKLAQRGAVIDPGSVGSWFDPSIPTLPAQTDPARISPKVASLLADVIQERTIFEPFFSARLQKAAVISRETLSKMALPIEKDAGAFMTPELAAALGLGYLIYRKGIPTSDIDALKKSIHDPSMAKKVLLVLVPLLAAGSVVDKMMSMNPGTKYPGEKQGGFASQVIAPVAGTYLYSAYAKRKAEQGRPVSGLEHLFIDYPLPLALGGVAAATKFLGKKAPKVAEPSRLGRTMAKSSAIISRGNGEERPQMQKSAVSEMLLAFGSGIYKPRLSGVAAFGIDAVIASALAAGYKKVFGTRSSGKSA